MKRRILLLSSVVFYKLCCDFVYTFYIYPVWGYQGFEFDLHSTSMLISYSLVIFVSFALPLNVNQLKAIPIIISILGMFIPLTSVASLGNHDMTPVLQVAFAIGLMFLVLRAKMPGFYWANQRYKRSDTSRPLRILVYGILIVVVPFVLYFLIKNGSTKLNFDVTQVYSFREDQKESLGSLLTVVSNWIGKILLPIGLVVAIYLEKRLFAVFFIVIIFALFGIMNSKSGVAYSFLALAFYLFSRNRPVSTYSLFLLASVFIVLTSAVAVILDLPLAAAFLVRRAIFTPSMLFLDYVNFFQAHTHVWWSNSLTAGLIDYPLDDNIGRSIASYNNKLSNANSGIFSMGYAHAGFLGLIIYSLCLAFIIKMIDKHADPKYMMVLSSVALGPLAHIILNVDLLTSMYTHGIGLFILICFLFFYRQHYVKSISSYPRRFG